MKEPTEHARGPADAPVVLLEYADFDCPYSGDGATIVSELRRAFADRLRHVFRHFPLADVHENAMPAALAAEAAGKQGRFWRMHHLLFQNQSSLSRETFFHFAEELGLDRMRFERDLDSDAVFRRVLHDIQTGERLGVDATPAYFINDIMYVGATDFESLSMAIEDALLDARRTAA